MPVRLFVGGPSFSTSTERLREAFAGTGSVESASVVTDRDTGRSRGFGFVEMATPEEAEQAISRLNGTSLDGRTIQVEKAKATGTGGGGDRRGGRGGRGGFGGRRVGGRHPPAARGRRRRHLQAAPDHPRVGGEPATDAQLLGQLAGSARRAVPRSARGPAAARVDAVSPPARPRLPASRPDHHAR